MLQSGRLLLLLGLVLSWSAHLILHLFFPAGGITSRIVYAREVIKVLSDAANVMDNLKKKATLFYDELEQKLATCNQIA